MSLSTLPFIFLIVPIMEIATFVFVGSQIGVLATIALVVVTAVTGATLLRVQGLATLSRIRRSLELGEMPDRQLIHGVMIMLAGILLMTPGFITDTLGLLLFVPPIRDQAWRLLRGRILAFAAKPGAGSRGSGAGAPVIELSAGDFSRADSRD